MRPGGVNVAPVESPTIGQVAPCTGWIGLGVVVRRVGSPRPPPSWPTITIDVGTVFVAPVGVVKARSFVRFTVSDAPSTGSNGTVITTGDQPPGDVGPSALHVAVEPATAPPQA